MHGTLDLLEREEELSALDAALARARGGHGPGRRRRGSRWQRREDGPARGGCERRRAGTGWASAPARAVRARASVRVRGDPSAARAGGARGSVDAEPSAASRRGGGPVAPGLRAPAPTGRWRALAVGACTACTGCARTSRSGRRCCSPRRRRPVGGRAAPELPRLPGAPAGGLPLALAGHAPAGGAGVAILRDAR